MNRRSSSCGTPRTATTAVRALSGALVAAALAVTLCGQAIAVPPPPPNPSDTDLAQADSRVQSQLGTVGDLINQVASANEQLRALDDEVARKREEVNKALVDLQNARDLADVANAAVALSRQALSAATDEIAAAQQKFDGYVAMSYTQGNVGATSVASYLGSATPDEVIDRAQVVELISQSRDKVLDGLQRARTEEANKDSAARKAKQDADDAALEATNKKAEAENAISVAESALSEQQSRKTEIESARNVAQAQLDAARSNVAGLEGQRTAYESWNAQQIAEQQAIEAAAETAQQIAYEAAARVAANQAARDRAAELAAGQRPHTQLDEPEESAYESPRTRPRTRTRPTPQATGSDAVETVIDRGMSQIGVEYAWGGGDENGPTLGIRDGGVADSYGDFNKVGFDCSGLMIYAFAGIGISLPHYTGYQYTAGEQVPIGGDAARRHDLLGPERQPARRAVPR